ncbi:MAG: Mo-dependent nitrogenase C-terminal domain-containing protein [Cyanobacteriota bacterium]|nr:Mo-dependent nitrogenase C-terminal domain-containing protein [Cyanobacteriota bacterium]
MQTHAAANSAQPLDFDGSPAQAHLWLRGLLSLAWADGHYDPQEQALIEDLIRSEWPQEADQPLEPISPEELGQQLDPKHAEDFLRTAVMTAVADGLYSKEEDKLLQAFSQALHLQIPQLELLRSTLVSGVYPTSEDASETSPDLLAPMRQWMDGIEVKNPKVAKFLCRLIPAQCPFERDVTVFGQKVIHIPPMCKLNPLYEQVVALRFRALSYLADQCGEDVTPYIQG